MEGGAIRIVSSPGNPLRRSRGCHRTRVSSRHRHRWACPAARIGAGNLMCSLTLRTLSPTLIQNYREHKERKDSNDFKDLKANGYGGYTSDLDITDFYEYYI